MTSKAPEDPVPPVLEGRTLSSITVKAVAPENGAEAGYIVEYAVVGRLVYGTWTPIERASKEAVTVTIDGVQHSLPQRVHQGSIVTAFNLSPDTTYAFRVTSVTLKAAPAVGAGTTLPVAEVVLGKTSKPSEPIRCATALEEIERLDSLVKAKDKQVQDFSSQLTTKEEELSRAKSIAAETQEQLETKEAELKAKAAQIDKAHGTISETKKTFADTDATRTQLQEKISENNALVKEKGQLLKDRHDALKQAEASKAAAQEQKVKMDALSTEVALLKGELETSNAALAEARAAAEAGYTNVITDTARVDELTKQLEQVTEEKHRQVQSLEALLAASKVEAEAVQKQMEQVIGERDDLEADVDALKRRLKASNAEAEKLKAQLKDLEKGAAQAQVDSAAAIAAADIAARAREAKAKDAFTAAVKEAQELATQLDTLQNSLPGMKKQQAELQAENTSLKEQLVAMTSQAARASTSSEFVKQQALIQQRLDSAKLVGSSDTSLGKPVTGEVFSLSGDATSGPFAMKLDASGLEWGEELLVACPPRNTAVRLVMGFRDFWKPIFGLPLEDEHEDGEEDSIQVCERGAMRWNPEKDGWFEERAYTATQGHQVAELVKGLEERLAQATSEITELKAKLEAAEKEAAEARAETAAVAATAAVAQGNENMAKEAAKTAARAADDLTEQLQALRKTFNDVKAHHATVQAENASLKEQLKASEESSAAAIRAHAELRAEVTDLQSQLTAAEVKLSSAGGQTAEAIASLKQRLAQSGADAVNLRVQLEAAKQELAKTRNDIAEAEARARVSANVAGEATRKAASTTEALDMALDKLKALEETHATTSQQHAELQTQNVSLQSQVKALEEKATASSDECSKLKAEGDALASQIAASKGEAAASALLVSEVREELKATKAELEGAKEHAELYQKDASRLAAEKVVLEDELKDASNKLAAAKGEIGDLQAQLFAAMEDRPRPETTATVARLERELVELNGEVTRLNALVQSNKVEYDGLKAANVHLEATVEKLEEDNEGLQAATALYIGDLGKLERELSKTVEEVSRLNEILAALQGTASGAASVAAPLPAPTVSASASTVLVQETGNGGNDRRERARSRAGLGPLGFPGIGAATAAVVALSPNPRSGSNAIATAIAESSDATVRRGIIRGWEINNLRPLGVAPPPSQISTKELQVLFLARQSQVSTAEEVERSLQLALMGFPMKDIVKVVKRSQTVEAAARELSSATSAVAGAGRS